MFDNPLFEYIIHLEAAINLLDNIEDLMIIVYSKNGMIKMVSKSEGFDFIIRVRKNGFCIEDKVSDIDYEYVQKSHGKICIRQRIKEDEFATYYEKGEYGQIELLKSVNIIQQNGQSVTIVCENKDNEELEQQENMKFADLVLEQAKMKFYRGYKLSVDGTDIPYVKALEDISKHYAKTIDLDIESEDRIEEYRELLNSIQRHLDRVKKQSRDESDER